MREKELRIALVCFGGVSLAVYMHGITKEILKLARASSAVHGIRDRAKRRVASFHDVHDENDPEYDTETIYFELLREIGHSVDLRVFVDIVAGASAGGINSIMLARALSHDLPMDRLRGLWLDNADVTELIASDAKAHGWSKWFLRPFFWAAGLSRRQEMRDREVRAKLSLLMRSRWFRPPFDGTKMAALMYDGIAAMGAPRDAQASLLPSGLGLDLFVTVTDFYGCQQLMQIHDPPVVHEREHRHVLHFRYRRRANGAVDSDFDLDNAPALAFAARATASIPGAFPPAQVLEMDALLQARGVPWPRRDDFVARNFEAYARVNVDPCAVPFVDGSVLNSRPFREAVTAIRGRPAFREVDRRVVYIDPNPGRAQAAAHQRVPGFFSTLKGALSEIPLAEPITDDLGWIARFNETARRLRAIIASARPHISRLVADMMAANDEPITVDSVGAWRAFANAKAARDAGFAYEAYVRLKLAAVRGFVSRLIANMRGVQPHSPFARGIAEIVDAWALAAGVMYEAGDGHPLQEDAAAPTPDLPAWVKFLLTLDVDYRKRRLNFLIEGQNRLYQMLGGDGFADLDPAAVDRLKRWFYDCLDALEKRAGMAADDPLARDLVNDIFRVAPSAADMKDIATYARAFAQQHREALDRLVARIGTVIDLQASTRDIDMLLAEAQGWPGSGLDEVLVNYLGFPFWDVLTFPVMPWREAGEFNEIRVDRISAQDAAGIARLGPFRLKGSAFNQFAAFLSRAYRENDYLLGRLHAADRLIDIVCDAAGPDALTPEAIHAFKRHAVRRILDAEEPHLATCGEMIARLRAALEKASSE
ncbi:MAG TPA: patatin-like protein [Xanthobacteraceae bacterium]|nr:patatin-like protein [Xanthobacteraceae bacterium]